MKSGVKNTLVLVCICAVMALLLAVTNFITAPVIAENQVKATRKALQQVMPAGREFVSLPVAENLPDTVTEVYLETSGGGYVFKLKTAGYSSDFVIMCGVDADGVVTGAVCLSSNETLGKEKDYGNRFTGLDGTGVSAVDTIAGATKTTVAYRAAVADAVSAAATLYAAEQDG